GEWLLVEFLYKTLAGVGIGIFLGWILYKLVFPFTSKSQQTKISRGILSLALTLIPYAIAQIAGSYGFLAVFFAASVFSHREKYSDHMDNLHDFTEEVERIFVALLFVIIGIYMASNRNDLLDIELIITALIIILIIRPIAGWISLLGKKISGFEKFVLSFYGIRGIGSIYYLMYALAAAEFADSEKLIQLTAVTIILSVLIHGISASTIQKKLDRYDS
ncbi:MAG TPA: cation:proton antiporter, partial [Flavobacterium sp.]|nr:cation:proton antiporter [Flavobacterium sp.]